jgi:hypothetical protein
MPAFPSTAVVAVFCVLAACAAPHVHGAALDISAPPSSASQLTAGAAYTIRWTPAVPSSTVSVSIVRCPTTTVAVRFCTEVTTYSSVPDNGAFAWTVLSPDVDDIIFRVVITSSATRASAVSGVFTVAPFLRTVSSRFVAQHL